MIVRTGGFDNVARNLSKMIQEVKSIHPKTLMDIGQHLESASSMLAPIDKGDLRASSYTKLVKDVAVRIGYTESYAYEMHENMQYTPQEPGTGPKYLTKPLMENERRYMRMIQSRYKV